MKITSLRILFLFALFAAAPAFGDTLALFENGTIATGNSTSTAADKNLASPVTGLTPVPDLTANVGRSSYSARAAFNGNINTGNTANDNWLAAVNITATTPDSASNYFEINLSSAAGYVLDLDGVAFDWQVGNNKDTSVCNYSCAVFVDFNDGNGFVKIGDTLTNSAKRTTTNGAAGFGTLKRANTFTPTTGNTGLGAIVIRIAVAADVSDGGCAHFFQNIKITGTAKPGTPPAPSPEVGIKLADNGAWTWFNDPRALFHNGTLYVGYVNMSTGRASLNACNIDAGTFTTVFSSTLTDVDDHNNPGLVSLPDGRLLAMTTRHSKDNVAEVFISKNTTQTPTAAGDWNPAIKVTPISSDGSAISYQNPFRLSAENGRLYSFTRATNWNTCLMYSDNSGSTWNNFGTAGSPYYSLHVIKNGTGSTRPYVKYASNNKDRVDMLYTDGHPRDVNNSIYHFYMKGEKFYKTDGTFLANFGTLPLDHAVGDSQRGSVVYQYSAAATTDYDDHIPAGRAWCHDLAYDKAGNPVCVFSVQVDGATWDAHRMFYYYARYTPATGWKKRFIAQAGRTLYSAEADYAGGIVLDPENPNIVYISTNAKNPFNLAGINAATVPLAGNSRYEIYRGEISGEIADASFATEWQPMTTNSAKDNFRPYVPRNSPYEQSLIYFTGNYNSYTSISAEVRGIFKNKKPSFAGWAAQNGLTGAAASPDADPGNTGITNLVAYAFGITPAGAVTESDRAKLPCMEKRADGTPVFRFEKNTALPDIDYIVETSVDLKNWETATSSLQSTEDNGIETLIVTPTSEDPRRFYRVKIVKK